MKGALTDHHPGLVPSTWMLGGTGQTGRAQAGLGLSKLLVGARTDMTLGVPAAPQCQERQPMGPSLQPLAS